MILLGIRCSPKEADYCVIDSSAETFEIIQLDKIVAPTFLSESEQLRHIRNLLLDILRENKVESTVVRITENNAHSPSVQRIRMEGVVIEAIASSEVKKYSTYVLNQIASKINVPKGDIKQIVKNEIPFDYVPNFDSYKKLEREAILAALSANY